MLPITPFIGTRVATLRAKCTFRNLHVENVVHKARIVS